MRILAVNGPNLNMLGTREPDVYGMTTLADLEESVSRWGEKLGLEVDHLQSNHEGELIDAVQSSDHDGIIINPGAFTHTSRALADAIASVDRPVVEVHISNVREREPWRAHSVLAGVATTSIYGRGITGYRDALRHLANRAEVDFEVVGYGPHREQVGDLRRGSSGLAVLVHGGFWRHEWTRDTMESLAVDLTKRGWNTWNIEYRRIGAEGGWPGSAHDVLTALDFAPQLRLGTENVKVVGHSAGAFLALWAGARTVTPLGRVVAMAPIADLAQHALSGSYGADEARSLIESGAPSIPDPGDIEALLVHGSKDRLVPGEHSSLLTDRHGLELMETDDGHFELLDPGREHWSEIVERLSD